MRFYLLIFGWMFTSLILAQDKLIKGRVFDAETQKPISWVEVSEEISRNHVFTNDSGYFEIKTYAWKGVKLSFNSMGFQEYVYQLDQQDVDTKELNLTIKLLPKSYQLPTVNVEVQKIDTVFGSKVYNVADFEFVPEGFVFLSYKKIMEKTNVLILANHKNMILHEIELPYVADKIGKDYLGFINVYCPNHIYRVEIKNQRIRLYELPREAFLAQIEPVKDSLKNALYFTDYRWDVPEFKYYLYDTLEQSVSTIHEVVDEELAELYHFEYYYLSNKDRVYAMKMEAATGVSRFKIANEISGFTHSLYYRPLYAPLYKDEDTILVFDHYKNKIFKYIENDSLPKRVVDIDYHLVKNWRTWENQLIQDENNPRYFYAVFMIKNKYFLKKIDGRDGQIKEVFSLDHQYVEDIRVKNGYAYYLYRPFESIQKKFLYRQFLK